MTPKTTLSRLGRLALPMLLSTVVLADSQTMQTPADQAIFRSTANFVQLQVRVRDGKGVFQPLLTRKDFIILEDGIEQKMDKWVVTNGGRTITEAMLAPSEVREDIIVPAKPRITDDGGRIWVVFIDDSHIQFQDTNLARDVIKQVKKVFKPNDFVAFVSSGKSSIEIQPTHDFKRIEEAMDKFQGGAMTYNEIINANNTMDGPAGLRYLVETAFKTAYDILTQLRQYNDRRKAFLYISSGYTLNPFKGGRWQRLVDEQTAGSELPISNSAENRGQAPKDPKTELYPNGNPFDSGTQEFSEAQLLQMLQELTNEANRSNVAFYPIDPRGLMAGPSMADRGMSFEDWNAFRSETISTLRILAEHTGGKAAVESNDISKFLDMVDNEMSDCYFLGYYSNNPDPMKKVRKIEVKLAHPEKIAGVQVQWSPKLYVVRPPDPKKTPKK